MKIVEIKCPNCSASLSVKGSKKNMVCEYCGAHFLLDDESTIVKHIKVGQITEEQEFINAETYLNKLKSYEEAYNCYSSLVKRYVDNKELWLGLLRSYTHDFTNKNVSLDKYKKYWNNYEALATKEEIAEYESVIDKYEDMIENLSRDYKTSVINDKIGKLDSDSIELIITIFLGPLGVHKFMKGQIGKGFLYLFTCGLFSIGWIIDIIKVVIKISNKS